MSQRGELLQSVAKTVADYRQDEIDHITPEHVDTWVNQFDKKDQLIILREMDKVLLDKYVCRNRAKELLTNLLGDNRIFENALKGTLFQTKFLSIQRKGNSQVELLELMDEILSEEYGVTIDQCGENEVVQYVYLDDGLFSGNTVRYDCVEWIPQAIENTTVHFIFFATHSYGLWYFKQRFIELVAQRNIQAKYWSFCKLNNFSKNNPHKYECMWPREIRGNGAINDYVALLHRRCEGRNFPPRVFRPDNVPRVETLFSSPEARDVVERAFLEAGAYIVSLPDNPHSSMRPMGYEYFESLGFGSVFVSYRNIPNNCPLALWWGDPNALPSNPLSYWYPLFLRKVNTDDQGED